MPSKLVQYRRSLKRQIRETTKKLRDYPKDWDQALLKGMRLGYRSALEELEKLFPEELAPEKAKGR